MAKNPNRPQKARHETTLFVLRSTDLKGGKREISHRPIRVNSFNGGWRSMMKSEKKNDPIMKMASFPRRGACIKASCAAR